MKVTGAAADAGYHCAPAALPGRLRAALNFTVRRMALAMAHRSMNLPRIWSVGTAAAPCGLALAAAPLSLGILGPPMRSAVARISRACTSVGDLTASFDF